MRARSSARGPWLLGLGFGAALVGSACGGGDKTQTVVTADTFDPVLQQALIEANVTPINPAPLENEQKALLGRALFFDKILSGNRNISCGSCHRPTAFSSDAEPVALGEGAVGNAPGRVSAVDPLDPDRVDFIPRNAPALFNVGSFEQTVMFHDGRVSRDPQTGRLQLPGVVGALLNVPIPQNPAPQSAEAVALEVTSALAGQALFPVLDRGEMRGDDPTPGDGLPDDDGTPGPDNELADVDDGDPLEIWSRIVDRLLAIPEYRTLFLAAFPEQFPDEPTLLANLNYGHVAQAIAAYQRRFFQSADSPFDRYVKGELGALTDQQKRGALLFFGRTRKGRCANCHSGPFLSDFTFHPIASPQVGPGVGAAAPDDIGREGVTGNAADRYRFRTPSLHNVALTGPYFHSGAFPTLRSVIVHYNDIELSLETYDPGAQLPADFLAHPAGLVDDDPTRIEARVQAALGDALLPPVLGLGEREIDDLVTFLESLTDPGILANFPVLAQPDTVPSGIDPND